MMLWIQGDAVSQLRAQRVQYISLNVQRSNSYPHAEICWKIFPYMTWCPAGGGERVAREWFRSCKMDPRWTTELWKYYSVTYRYRKDLVNMNQIHNILNDPDQYLISKYKFELQLCGKPIYDLCINFQFQTLINTYGELWIWVIKFMDLMIVDLDNK